MNENRVVEEGDLCRRRRSKLGLTNFASKEGGRKRGDEPPKSGCAFAALVLKIRELSDPKSSID